MGECILIDGVCRREDIEYPAGGGGVYSKTSDYVLLLQYLLQHYLSFSSPTHQRFAEPILSDESIKSLFTGTLSAEAKPAMERMLSSYLDSDVGSGEADWTTGMALYTPHDSNKARAWGRKSGSVSWGGAAGTVYWMDPVSQIAVSPRSIQSCWFRSNADDG